MNAMQTRRAWQRAMDAATNERKQAEKIGDLLYAVASTTKQNGVTRHLVRLSATTKQGGMPKIVRCDCKGWDMWAAGKATRPCKHAGAVCKRICRERHIALPIWTPELEAAARDALAGQADEAAMHEMEARGDREQTAREEAAKHAWKQAAESDIVESQSTGRGQLFRNDPTLHRTPADNGALAVSLTGRV